MQSPSSLSSATGLRTTTPGAHSKPGMRTPAEYRATAVARRCSSAPPPSHCAYTVANSSSLTRRGGYHGLVLGGLTAGSSPRPTENTGALACLAFVAVIDIILAIIARNKGEFDRAYESNGDIPVSTLPMAAQFEADLAWLKKDAGCSQEVRWGRWRRFSNR